MTNGKRMTNQFTDAQVEAAAKAYWLASEREIHDKPITWEWDKEERRRYMWAARQVLAGIAPQAPEGRELDALRALIENRARVIEGFSGAPAEVAAEQKAIARSIRRDLEDHDFEFRVAPEKPSSTVDEGKLAEVIAAHEMTSWGSRKWSGCECGEVYEVCPEGIVKWHANHRARAVVEAIGGESRGE